MKRLFFFASVVIVFLLCANSIDAQGLKVGVFDIDMMVQAMPGYRNVDSLTRLYEKDSLGAEYDVYQSEYTRLDSTFKSDSVLVTQGKKTKVALDYVGTERQKIAMNIVYWQQIAQNKSNTKRANLSQPLYIQVVEAYKKVQQRKKYNLILKPNSYEAGFPIDNIFITVAKELKLTELPQQMLYLGEDPDAPKQAAGISPKPNAPAAAKPKKN